MSEPFSSSSLSESPKQLVDDNERDMFGGRTLKILDKNNILADAQKAVDVPLAQFLQWKVNEDRISELKARLVGDNPFETALEYFSHTEKFEHVKFNVSSLDDDLTEGGIDFGGITEIYGEAGSGKSQLCMQLALNVQLPAEFGGINGKAIYISTDKRLSITRLAEMVKGLKEKHIDAPSVQDIIFLDNIVMEFFNSSQDLEMFVQMKLPNILAIHHNIKLIIIDSIAGIFRIETEYFQRAKTMRSVVHELERLSEIHNFAIVTTNHVTSVPQVDPFAESVDVAALGATWDSLVVTKLKVQNTNQFAPSRVRTIDVMYSPRLPSNSAKFIITSNGIENIQENC